MGCEQSTPVAVRDDPLSKRYKDNLKGVGQTERQISKMQRAAMNNDISDGKKGASEKPPPKLDEQGYLMPEEVAKRTFSSIANKELTLGTLSNVTHCQYAHWTQRGYYPDDPHKQNQDEFGVHSKFVGVDNDAMFAVYDGHGLHGAACSQFAKERLPKAIAKHVRKVQCHKYTQSRHPSLGKKGAWDPSKWPLLSRNEYESCCKRAFLEVNQAMHDAPDVVDTLSGTTATSVNFHGNFVSICNVGDSRVILGHRVSSEARKGIAIHYPVTGACAPPPIADTDEEKNDIDEEVRLRTVAASPLIEPGSTFDRSQRSVPGTNVVAIPLSKDQTPYRRDERERVKALGATVMSIDQMQGKEELHEDWGDMVLGETLDLAGDSPRVWVSGQDYPGCAFTRSLGDSLSESIGVSGAPEILSTELTQNDEYLVVASDGIFEFLTNQTVIDFCAASESPLVACEKIVRAAYQRWLTYENRTDDITIVVCFLQNFNQPQLNSTKGTTEELVGTATTMYGQISSRLPPPPESVPALMQESEVEEAVAYTSQEAQANIVRHSTLSPAPRIFQTEEDRALAAITRPSTASNLPPPPMTFEGDEEDEDESEADVIRASTPPAMTFDNTEVIEVKVDSMEDNRTSKTASVTSADDNMSDQAEHKKR